jgi:TonB family protein
MLTPPSAALRCWQAALAASLLSALPPAALAQSASAQAAPALWAVPEAEALLPDTVGTAFHLTGCAIETLPAFRGKSGTQLSTCIHRELRGCAAGLDLPNGRLLVRFVVDASGRTGNVRIVRGLHPRLDAEVLRVMRTLPGFVPATRLGKPISMEMTLPVEFKFR